MTNFQILMLMLDFLMLVGYQGWGDAIQKNCLAI